ncbi:cell division protein FtsK [Mycobacteroides abscessus subsp. abscessus]|nr:cell division protein FtsK [Mycobacteroides abscessus subsp. abscessus]
MAIVFGVLLLTGTTIRDVPDTLRNMFSPRDYDEWDEEWDDPDYEDYEDGQSEGDYEATREFTRGATPMDNYPIEEEAAAAPEPRGQ